MGFRQPSSEMGFFPSLKTRKWLPRILGGGNSNIVNILIPNPGEMIQFDDHIFQRGLKPPTRYTYYHIFLFEYVQMRWKKNNKSGWLISGITVPAVIGISIDPGESLFKSNKGFIIEISFGSKKWISIATFCHIGFSLMKFLEGERFWVFQNLTHASCFMRGTGGTLHPYLPYHKTRYYIIIYDILRYHEILYPQAHSLSLNQVCAVRYNIYCFMMFTCPYNMMLDRQNNMNILRIVQLLYPTLYLRRGPCMFHMTHTWARVFHRFDLLICIQYMICILYTHICQGLDTPEKLNMKAETWHFPKRKRSSSVGAFKHCIYSFFFQKKIPIPSPGLDSLRPPSKMMSICVCVSLSFATYHILYQNIPWSDLSSILSWRLLMMVFSNPKQWFF